MSKLNELKDQKVKILADATTILNRGLNTPTVKAQYEALLEQDTEISESISMPSLPVVSAPVTAPAVVRSEGEQKSERRAKLNKTWRDFIRGNTTEETRALLTSSDGSGGAVVAQEFSGFLSETLKTYCAFFDYANVRQSPNGHPVKISKVDDSTHGLTYLSDEGSVSLTDTDPTFSSTVVNTDLLSSGLTRFSNQLLSDSYFDLEQLLTSLTSSRIGRGIEKLLTLGLDQTGAATPNNSGVVSLSQIAATTGTIAAGVGWQDLVNVFDSLDAAFLPKSVWLMSSKTRNSLAGLKDSTGRSYFVPGTANSLDYLLGRPIVLNQSLPQITTANAKAIIFGSLYDGLQVVSSEVRVQTLVERFAEKNESALLATIRIGSTALQAGALQALRIAAA
jgi:HK97 family phage major capsid protein